jgi:multidrug efflux pump subunit AcrA (membrane-fusion protein)
MVTRNTLAALLLVVAVGCGPVTYVVDVDSAESEIAAAQTGNAAYYAPYELNLAEAQLAKAREEASHGQYEDAIRRVELAYAYAKRAQEISGRQGSEFGR